MNKGKKVIKTSIALTELNRVQHLFQRVASASLEFDFYLFPFFLFWYSFFFLNYFREGVHSTEPQSIDQHVRST